MPTYKTEPIPLTKFVTTGTGVPLGASAGTPVGAMGLTAGSFGSATPVVVSEAANGNSKTDYMRLLLALPQNYRAGAAIIIRIRAKVGGALATSQTIDLSAYLDTNGATLGSDLCETAAQSVTTSLANYDFTITPTGLSKGDVLDLQITAVADDTGGTANKVITIQNVWLLHLVATAA